MNRRNFIKAASCGALLTGALPSVSHAAAENRPPIPGSLGMLYDSTLCVGCQACVTKCQDINFPERNPQGEQTWSNNDKLSPYTNNIIQVWTSGTGVNKDQEENGYAYIKKQCMHCVDPNCVSVCPVSALKKGSENRHCPLRQRCVHRLPLLHGRLPIQRAEVRLQQPVWCAA